jgi:hypothetical protein
MFKGMMRKVFVFSAVFILSLSLAGQSALAGQNKNNSPTNRELIITEVSIDFDSGTIVIRGDNFDNGGTPTVLLGNDTESLTLMSDYTADEITAELPAIPDGDYRLTVYTGNGTINYDSYDLTIGAVGPQGPKGDKPAHDWSGTRLGFENPDGTWGNYVDLKGEKGDTGPQGAQGPQGIQGLQGPAGSQGPQGPPGSNSNSNINIIQDSEWAEMTGWFASDTVTLCDEPGQVAVGVAYLGPSYVCERFCNYKITKVQYGLCSDYSCVKAMVTVRNDQWLIVYGKTDVRHLCLETTGNLQF